MPELCLSILPNNKFMKSLPLILEKIILVERNET
jgi:hypothetical protein